MSFHAIPEVKLALRGSQKLFKRVLLAGTLVSVIFYVLFTLVVLGYLGINTPEISTLSLGTVFVFLGILTMFTSYLAAGNALIENFKFDERSEALRGKIREFVTENIPADMMVGMFVDEHFDEDWAFYMKMAKKLSEIGWLTMSWPKEYSGMDASVWERCVMGEEAGYWGIPGLGMGVSGTAWVGPSLMLFGTEEQKQKYMELMTI